MNNLLRRFLCAGLLAAGAAAGTTGALAAADSKNMTLPIVTKMVHPDGLPTCYEGVTVTLAMTIDEKGVPHDVVPADRIAKDLAARLIPVVAQWRFTPCVVDGHAVARKVLLPLKLVDERRPQSAVVSLPGATAGGGPMLVAR